MKSISLYFKSGASDKEYHAQIEKKENGFVVNFQYGRVGSTLQTGSKTSSPVSEAEAGKIFDKLVKEKVGKGYTTGETKNNFSGDIPTEKKIIMTPQLLNPIDENEVERYINDGSYLAQEKLDGERRIVISNGSVTGLNKKGTEVQLPDDIINSLKGIHCIVDGEIIGDKLYVFDLLSKDGTDIKHMNCRERIAMLNSLKFGNGICMIATAYTPNEKAAMRILLGAKNAEGIVFKNKLAEYTPGRPASGGNAVKFKFYKTATFIVEGSTKGKRSVGLLLMSGDEKIFLGKVTIPANHEIPEAGDLVEVRYLYANRGGAVYQPVYLGKRTDSDLTDATIDQLIYKAE